MCVHAAIEFSERLSYFGIATSLVVYFTTILHQDLKMAVRNANYWSGVTTLMPLLGGFVADAYLGRYATVLLATIIYLMVITSTRKFDINSVFNISNRKTLLYTFSNDILLWTFCSRLVAPLAYISQILFTNTPKC